jgi:hypothetical protein
VAARRYLNSQRWLPQPGGRLLKAALANGTSVSEGLTTNQP